MPTTVTANVAAVPAIIVHEPGAIDIERFVGSVHARGVADGLTAAAGGLVGRRNIPPPNPAASRTAVSSPSRRWIRPSMLHARRNATTGGGSG
jgi:hypothetical protein